MTKYILLIDDDEDELGIFTDALKIVGDFYKCTYAADAEQAMDILKIVQPDFIFVDYNLPKINGLEFISVAGKTINPGATRIYLYSTKINNDTLKMARLLGAAGCIEKSVTIGELARELKVVLQQNYPSSTDLTHEENNSGK
jgi:DNA-binding response OmpR family regulator